MIGIDADETASRARREGGAEAREADLRLRLQESLEREKRLVDRILEAEEKVYDALGDEHLLRMQVAAYAAFHRDVERSAAWRLIQFLRGLFGRKW